MTKHLWLWGIAVVVGGTLLALTHLAVAGPGPGQGGETRIKILLTVDPAILVSNPAAQASAEFRSRPGRTRLVVEVSGMPSLNGQTLNVAYSASALSPSSMVVDALGHAQLEANGAATPPAGATVTITKAIGGGLVAGAPATF